jgi:hypothetical protein
VDYWLVTIRICRDQLERIAADPDIQTTYSPSMDLPSFDVTLLPGEWWEVRGAAAVELEDELLAEAGPGHPLQSASVQAVAVRKHLKDVVFWVPAARQWALVHLTGDVDSDPRWPSTFLSAEWDDLVDEL